MGRQPGRHRSGGTTNTLRGPVATRAALSGSANKKMTDMLRLTEDNLDGVDMRALQPGTTVVVETRHSRYRFFILIDPPAVLVKGGGMFPDHTVVRLVGATAGGSAVKMGWILIGFRIEMQLGSVCIRSSPVRSVKVENTPPSIWQISDDDVVN